MPIYEYRCSKCRTDFEKLIFNTSQPVECPVCSSTEVTKKMSRFGMAGVGEKAGDTAGSSCGGCTATSCSTCK
ncbi:MAG: zinc ribbon domain-containing protein [Nitrospirota bacterium]